MEYDRLIELIDKIENKTASGIEQEELELFYQSFEHHQGITSGLLNEEIYKTDLLARILSAIEMMPTVRKTKQHTLWPRMAIAAAVSTILVAAGLFFFNNQHKEIKQTTAVVKDIAPGKVGATLTLANGKKIRLADAANGQLARQAGLTVTKSADGKLMYEMAPAAPSRNEENITNTLSTAKGETYQVRLPDGSLVWLNAASSLTYSASLNERGLRRVRLEGEGYFEIFKDKAHPFVVESNGQQVEVLGTHFNINAYADEPAVKTTLLEGSVAVAPLSSMGREGASRQSAESEVTLKPGQQSILTGPNRITVKKVDTEEVVAWKDGYFRFYEVDLGTFMTTISRWYDIEVSYQGGLSEYKDLAFGGSVSRTKNISEVLKILSQTGKVHYKIEGRKVIISK